MSFERGGYLACLCIPFVFALALAQCLRAPQLLARADVSLMAALLAALAAVLGAISAIFDLRSALQKRRLESFVTPLAVGLLVGLLLLGVTRLHAAFGWLVVGIVALRMIVMIVRAGITSAVFPLLSGGMIGYWAFLLSFVDGYKTPWINEAIATGTVHVDLMFHAAIANMLSGYGTGTLGVDGLIPFPYHFGSHHVMTVLYPLLGIGALQFYSVIFPLLFCPLLLVFMYFFALSFRDFLARTSTGASNWKDEHAGWYWVIFAIIFIGVISTPFRRTLGVWDNIFHSESFGVAVLFAYLAGIWCFEHLGREQLVRLAWYMWLVIPLYFAILCLLKISVGLVVGGMAAYLFLRIRMTLAQRILGWIAIALPLCYGLWVTRSSSGEGLADPGLMAMTKPFAFLRDIVPAELRPVSFAAFFGPLIVLVVLRLLSRRSGAQASLWARISGSELLDVELAIVITVVSVIPGLLLSVPQGGTNFFAEVSYWWVQPMLAVVAGRLLAKAVT
ncbi:MULTISPECIES: hypothetical protein [Cupriavidus]